MYFVAVFVFLMVAPAALSYKLPFFLFAFFVFLRVDLGDPSVLGSEKIPWWGILLISLGCALLTALVVWFIVCPLLKKKIERKSYLCVLQKILSNCHQLPLTSEKSLLAIK